MSRERIAALVLLAGLGGYCCHQPEAPRPEPPRCPGPDCPAPRPAPPAPVLPPAPSPLPQPAPCPQPSPQPRPWDATSSAPVGASVGGYVTPDGAPCACPLPDQWQRKNVGGSDGAGLCVFTSIGHAAEWQDVPQLKDFQQWMRRHPGGGYPSKVKAMIDRKCREANLPVPRYIQVEGADLDILRLACRTGRMPSVTYGVSASGRYGGSRIAHMVSLPHADAKWFSVLDNNYIGSNRIEHNTEAEFRRAYTTGGGGWSVILLDYGVPPRKPRPAEAVYDQCPGGRCAPSVPLAVPLSTPLSATVRDDGSYRWVATTRPDVYALYQGTTQLGNWYEDDQVYRRLIELTGQADRWEDCDCPVEVPEQWRRRKAPENYGIDYDGWRRDTDSPPRYWLNGRECSRPEVVQALVGDGLVDDSALPWLVAVGDRPRHEAALAALQAHPEMRPVLGRLKFKGYDPANWHVAFSELSPGLTLRRADGTELLHVADLSDLKSLVERVLVALGLRQPPAPPAPAPAPDGPTGPVSRVPWWGWLAGGLGLLMLLFPRPQTQESKQ